MYQGTEMLWSEAQLIDKGFQGAGPQRWKGTQAEEHTDLEMGEKKHMLHKGSIPKLRACATIFIIQNSRSLGDGAAPLLLCYSIPCPFPKVFIA